MLQDDRTAGKVKETVGGLTGDHSKKNEGACVHRYSRREPGAFGRRLSDSGAGFAGKAQNAGGKVQDKVTDPIKGAAKGVKEAVTVSQLHTKGRVQQ